MQTLQVLTSVCENKDVDFAVEKVFPETFTHTAYSAVTTMVDGFRRRVVPEMTLVI